MADNLEKVLSKKGNLYRLTLCGSIRDCYVVASDPTAAQEKVLRPLNADNYGFSSDRIVKTIELIAENNLYAKLPFLFL